MSKQEAKYTAVILLVVTAIFFIGYVAGYVHVIVNSEAYVIENGDCLMLEVDGHEFVYEVSPAFYERFRADH